MIRYANRHRELEARLEDNNQRMEALLQSAGNAVITADDHGSVLTFNQTAQTLFGYSPEEIVGTNVSRLMPEPYSSQHDDYIRHYEETGDLRILRDQLAASEFVEDRTLEGALAYLRGVTDEEQCKVIRDRIEEMDFEAASAVLESVLHESGIDLS